MPDTENPLEVVRVELEKLYARLIGQELRVSSSLNDMGSDPHWVYQDQDLNVSRNPEFASGAAVFDPEIGLCLLLQKFSRELDIRPQITKALRVRSRLRPRQEDRLAAADDLGEWSVVVHWIVEESDFEAWVDQVSGMRRDTAHFEELPVDAVINLCNDWALSCALHGFPRLLLRTREVIRRRNFSEAFDWISADTKIAEKVRRLPIEASSATEQRLAESLLQQLDRLSGDRVRSSSAGKEAVLLKRIRVQDFRNIGSLNISFGEPGRDVSCHVFQGPNGSGKSSIFEAVSLAVAGVSSRLIDFCEDSNVKTRGKARDYIAQYLPALNVDARTPLVAINEEELSAIEPLDDEDATERARLISGTFMSQAFNDSLVHKAAQQLGADVAGSYSVISEWLLRYIIDARNSAETLRADFNRRWGLRANVTKVETARSRIVEVALNQAVPAPEPILERLNSERLATFEGLSTLASQLRRLERWNADRSRVVEALSSVDTVAEAEALLLTYFKDYQSVVPEIVREANRLFRLMVGLSREFSKNVWTYATWASSRAGVAVNSEVLERLQVEREQIRKELGESVARGRSLSLRLEHLKLAEEFISGHWNDAHPDECPTCGTDFDALGGISAAVNQIREETAAGVEEERARYRALQAKEKEIIAEQERNGASELPLGDEAANEVRSIVHRLFGEEREAEEVFSQSGGVDLLLSVVALMQRPLPSIAQIEDVDALAKEVSSSIFVAFNQFTEVSETPDAWKSLEARYLKGMTEAIVEHLPESVQALWLELARNMMPARWQSAGEVRFDVEPRRGNPEARVVVRGKSRSALAAHILNGAEVHNLALSWFIVRYLTYGRFNYAFLVLDDPAQQMDQPTFRDLCRLLNNLLRLHKRHEIPLTMLVFLHQDERALDAARATDALLHLLRWNRGGPNLITSMRMRAESYRPVRPQDDIFDTMIA